MKYLIDTNICIYIMNRRPIEVINKFSQFAPGDIAVSSITVSELEFGVTNSLRKEENKIRLDEFLIPFEVLPYDQVAAKAYGIIRTQLEKAGRPLGPLDMLIAAHALSRNLVLVTNNQKEFKKVKDLKVENWVKSDKGKIDG
jgi:tRNA(fMet)-specific endonuclease VapC